MSANQAQYPVQVMARALGVSRSGFYAFEGRGPSNRAVGDAALVKQIKRIHKASKQTYGAPRIHADRADEGTPCWPQTHRTTDAGQQHCRCQPPKVRQDDDQG